MNTEVGLTRCTESVTGSRCHQHKTFQETLLIGSSRVALETGVCFSQTEKKVKEGGTEEEEETRMDSAVGSLSPKSFRQTAACLLSCEASRHVWSLVPERESLLIRLSVAMGRSRDPRLVGSRRRHTHLCRVSPLTHGHAPSWTAPWGGHLSTVPRRVEGRALGADK